MGTSTKSHQSVYPLNHPGNQEFPWAVPVDTEEYGRSRAAPDLSDVLAGHNNHREKCTLIIPLAEPNSVTNSMAVAFR
jgi:hypothetical protein